MAWQDGHLIITRSSGWMWLKDIKRVTIRKGTVGPDIMKGIVVCGMVKCAGYDIKILSDTSVNACDTHDQSQVPHTTKSAVMLQNENLEPSPASSSYEMTYSTESRNRNMTDCSENRNKIKPLNSDQNSSNSKTAPKHAHNNQYDSAPSQQNQRQNLKQNPSEAKPSNNIKTIIRARPIMGLDSSVAARREKQGSMDLENCVTARREKQGSTDLENCVTARLETQENVDDFRRAMKDRKDKMIALKKSKVEQERQVMSEQKKIVLSTRALCPIVQSERNRNKMKQNCDGCSSSSSNYNNSSSSSSNNNNSSSSSTNNNNNSSSSGNSNNSSSSSRRDNNCTVSNSTNNINMIDQGIAPIDSKRNGQDPLQQRDGSIEDRMKEKPFNKYMINDTVAGMECGKNKVGKHNSSKSGSSNGSSSSSSSSSVNSNNSSSSGSSNHGDNNRHNTSIDTNTDSSCTEYPILDPQVLQVMRPHQLQAAVFLLNVLMGRTVHSGDVSNLSKECTDKVRTHLINTVYEGDKC
jgi:hypothetical protein